MNKHCEDYAFIITQVTHGNLIECAIFDLITQLLYCKKIVFLSKATISIGITFLHPKMNSVNHLLCLLLDM